MFFFIPLIILLLLPIYPGLNAILEGRRFDRITMIFGLNLSSTFQMKRKYCIRTRLQTRTHWMLSLPNNMLSHDDGVPVVCGQAGVQVLTSGDVCQQGV